MPARPPPLPDWARRFRPPVDRAALGIASYGPDRRSVVVGLIATVFVNLLFISAPVFLKGDTSILPLPADDLELELDEAPVELPPEMLVAPENPPPQVVQTNPDTPESFPTDTQNESDRNQRAANELTPEALSPDHSPAREGEDLPTNRIVPGELAEEAPATPPPSPEGEPAAEILPSAPAERNPLPGEADELGESPEGVGSSIAPRAEIVEPTPERIEGEPIETPEPPPLAPVSPASGAQQAQPAPRPRVARTAPGPVQRQLMGVSQTGSIEVDARFSEYGDYITRLVDAVSQHWHTLCASRVYAESSTHVVVRFTLTRDGRVHHLVTTERTSAAVGEFLCRTAIEQGQPYGAWTDDMILSLGEEEPVVLIFYYR